MVTRGQVLRPAIELAQGLMPGRNTGGARGVVLRQPVGGIQPTAEFYNNRKRLTVYGNKIALLDRLFQPSPDCIIVNTKGTQLGLCDVDSWRDAHPGELRPDPFCIAGICSTSDSIYLIGGLYKSLVNIVVYWTYMDHISVGKFSWAGEYQGSVLLDISGYERAFPGSFQNILSPYSQQFLIGIFDGHISDNWIDTITIRALFLNQDLTFNRSVTLIPATDTGSDPNVGSLIESDTGDIYLHAYIIYSGSFMVLERFSELGVSLNSVNVPTGGVFRFESLTYDGDDADHPIIANNQRYVADLSSSIIIEGVSDYPYDVWCDTGVKAYYLSGVKCIQFRS